MKPPLKPEAGFSLIEMIIATAIFLTISSVITSALLQVTNSQRTIWNRTEMHAGVRSATELLQQEVGQAGRVALPTTVALNGAQITISNTVDYNANPIQASFSLAHASGAPVSANGGFRTGVVPPSAAPASFANGSTGTVLKMYGDINGDGNMVYIEYTCDTVNGYLYRNSMAFNSAPPKPAAGPSQILLSNITANPNNVACFQYQLDATNAFVLDVAITLTVNTQQIDPITRQLQNETKALLNVSPRNVMDAWELFGHSYSSRVQPTPATVTALLP
jgi:prepilin-type N-terminal cleavage/methylation domain-containing protein